MSIIISIFCPASATLKWDRPVLLQRHFSRQWKNSRTCLRPGLTWPGAGMNWGRWPRRPGLLEKGMTPVKKSRLSTCFMHRPAISRPAGRPDSALTVFEQLMAAHPEAVTLEWKQTLVNILFALEKFRKALPWLEELAADTKGDTRRQWQEMLLYQYLSLEMKKKALAYARYLTRAHSEDPCWWKVLAHVHLTDKRFEKALAWAQKGLKKTSDPDLLRIKEYVLTNQKKQLSHK